MRFLADENFPGDAVKALRDADHDVQWVRTDFPGISDNEVSRRARDEKRTILTFDKDFGELAFHARLPAECGIILFRISKSSPAETTRVVLAAIQSRDAWIGEFSVVEPDRIRVRPLL